MRGSYGGSGGGLGGTWKSLREKEVDVEWCGLSGKGRSGKEVEVGRAGGWAEVGGEVWVSWPGVQLCPGWVVSLGR